jgi:formamidopyrimidine-DNA glycosylase
MWMDLIDPNGEHLYLLNTYGLTGRWSFNKTNSSRIEFVIQSKSDSNKKYYLYYNDQRNFGTIEFTQNIDILNKKLNKLAPDILQSNLSTDEIVNLFKKLIKKGKRDKNLVKVLMNQELVVSGIGNYLVAEILYDAKLNPHRSLTDLSNTELERLAYSIRKIAKQAYYNNTSGYMDYFKTFMTTHADKIDKNIFPNYHTDIPANEPFQFKVYQLKHDHLGNKVHNDEIVKGRTIHWVPDVQK